MDDSHSQTFTGRLTRRVGDIEVVVHESIRATLLKLSRNPPFDPPYTMSLVFDLPQGTVLAGEALEFTTPDREGTLHVVVDRIDSKTVDHVTCKLTRGD